MASSAKGVAVLVGVTDIPGAYGVLAIGGDEAGSFIGVQRIAEGAAFTGVENISAGGSARTGLPLIGVANMILRAGPGKPSLLVGFDGVSAMLPL